MIVTECSGPPIGLSPAEAWYALPFRQVLACYVHGRNLRRAAEADAWERVAWAAEVQAVLRGVKDHDLKQLTAGIRDHVAELRTPEGWQPPEVTVPAAHRKFFRPETGRTETS